MAAGCEAVFLFIGDVGIDDDDVDWSFAFVENLDLEPRECLADA